MIGEEEQGGHDPQKTLEKFQDIAHEGALFSDWSRMFCTKQFLLWLDSQITDEKNAWLAMQDREKAEAVRLQAQAYTKVKNWLASKINAGNLAAKGIKDLHDQGVELEGMIRPPTQS